MSRIAELPLAEMSEAQRRVHDDIVSGPRGAVMKGFPPLFQPWLRSPGMADPAQRLGAFVRLESSLPPRISELAILITARFWECAYEWSSHQRFAREAGIGEDIIAAIADQRRPDFDSDDQAAVYDFCIELHQRHAVAEDTYRTATGHLVIAFATGDTFRLRCQRTDGSDNLHTVDEGSAITVEVTR